MIREFDIVGSIIIIGAIVSLIMAIQFGGTLYAWNSGTTIALFVVAGVLFIAFGIQQAYAIFTTMDRRVFPSHFLRNHNAVLLYMVASAVNTAGFIPIYYIPLYFQFTQGDDPIKAGVRLLPLICVLSVFILLNGHLSKHCPLTTPWITLLTLPTTVGRFSYFQPWYIFGSVLTLIGGVLLCMYPTLTLPHLLIQTCSTCTDFG